MSLGRQISRGLRTMLRPADAEQDLSDEVEHYIDQATAAFLATGLSLEEARRAARLQCGHPRIMRDQVRASGWEHGLDTLMADVRYAWRRLRHTPAFTMLAVVTLGAGIGAATAMFSAVHPLLFAALPYPEAQRIVTIADAGRDGDPAIVGQEITLDGVPFLVIGVMPRTFENVVAPAAELWAPLQYETVFGPDSRESGHHLRLIARLRPNVTLDEAKKELGRIADTPAPEFARVPWASLANGFVATSLQADMTRGIRPALQAVIGAVILLLAITCVNVTNLLLARGAQRRGEVGVRTPPRAGRGRLIRQLLTETVLLACLAEGSE